MSLGYLHWHDFLDDKMIALARYATVRNRVKFNETTVTTGELGHRKSKVLWHYEYQDLYDAFTNRIRNFLPDLRQTFPDVPANPNIELQLTTHNTGEFFKRHLDNASPDTAMRVLTYVYYFTLEDEKRFSGGQLILEPHTGGKYVIEPNHNTIIFFPSDCWHEVTPVQVPGDRWEDSRCTLNGWIRK